jgi:hypothetical protein
MIKGKGNNMAMIEDMGVIEQENVNTQGKNVRGTTRKQKRMSAKRYATSELY